MSCHSSRRRWKGPLVQAGGLRTGTSTTIGPERRMEDAHADRLREANRQCSRLVKAVKQGKEGLLIERGKPLAVVKLIEEHDDAHAAVRRLEMVGLLRPASKRRALPAWTPPSIRGAPVSSAVIKDGEER